MLRHFGTKRTYKHNLWVAVLLSFVAGFVNAAGFLGFFALTTNVTGHAALFAEQIASRDWNNAGTIAIWMLLFLIGAWCSSLIVTRIGHHERFSFAIPIFIELVILIFCAIYGSSNDLFFPKNFFVGCLLFAMGLQNALVSVISGSVVRTTHLTGTFTDLGIELAQLKLGNPEGQQELVSKIKLRLSIILFFMIGALSGAYLFRYLNFMAFLLPCFVLCFTLFFDIFRLRVKRYYTNLIHHIKEK
ncbi:hypothetical protein AQ505_12590 [Pedobacter sp. PACM 27299]|uniref:YoaK family protein n=1 Tax=Pedobacter sp. PACM 27299 TaxID=1727164 RepID=UPI0007067D57|nr:YoaK family protein [Pedobacter sp. PACM 27299]ALL06256.1 hypothetical protein AQ505_12590 [Pedobacter sp. PACM 27299]